MRFIYMVAALNEQEVLQGLCHRLEELPRRYPGSLVYLLDNGSTDRTWPIMQELAAQYPFVRALHLDRRGMGLAYRRGLAELDPKSLTKEDRIVLTAADLPFGFTDIESLAALPGHERDAAAVIIGSKSHERSKVARDWKRRIGSRVFQLLRLAILGLKTKDTQGTILIRGDLVAEYRQFKADDYFFAVEIIDRAERTSRVIEVPVTLEPELRASKVNLVRDGWRMVKQLFKLRLSGRR